jgi:CheY-like chemotaxis protein
LRKIGPILIVEDDPKDVELTKTSLAELNLANEIVVARDGVEALDYLLSRGPYEGRGDDCPAVVLMDIKMPRLDGIEVLRQIKSHESLKLLPVVMLTSSRESVDLKRCYELGVNAYVVKPVKFGDFMRAVKEVGGFWAIINEPPPL